MRRTEMVFDTGTVPLPIREHLEGATIYDSSCSENARTLYIHGTVRAFLKISRKGTLERERRMTEFLHGHRAAPRAIAYESDADCDYLLTEAVAGEDGTDRVHLDDPERLAQVFGQYLRMLHSLPAEGCPYPNRTAEMVKELQDKGIEPGLVTGSAYEPVDDVVIHGDYCLPNIILDRFTFKGFIDLGYGGIGDRHFDLYWGIWTLRYNLKTDRYRETFLDAYGRSDVDAAGISYFAKLAERL